jgi:homoaconitase/3-isopropylmalate dehydratase large subunit
MVGKHLNGCFIGACTTTEEDHILAGMLLKRCLEKGMVPTASSKRKVVPGSMPILNWLRMLGFIDVYEQVGFKIGIPGCSYRLGMSADKEGKGE